jgi:5-methyltetrahydropteroyltriglutamate--homocysteine methyltransferase
MMPTAPFRADHVGSLLRPAYLLEARAKAGAGALALEELEAIEDRAVRELVAMQEDVGLKGVTDGEARRETWHMDYIYQIGGIEKSTDKLRIHFENQEGDKDFEGAALRVREKLSLPTTIFEQAFRFLKDTVTKGVPKLTIPSPSMVHYRGGRAAIDEAIYPDIHDFYNDLADVYAHEIENLGALGCTYLQLDDTSLAYLNDPRQRAMIAEQGGDPESQHEVYIEVINRAVAAKPAGMTLTTHLCRGNFRSSWAATGSYDHVADALFNKLDVDGYFLEFDDARSGGFEPLRFLPHGRKRVVLGLVTTKSGTLEQRDEILRRIEAAAKFAPLDQLCLSPQCGFSSTKEGNALTFAEQRAKLELVVDVAREVWGDA